jgi:hypothetical protein
LPQQSFCCCLSTRSGFVNTCLISSTFLGSAGLASFKAYMFILLIWLLCGLITVIWFFADNDHITYADLAAMILMFVLGTVGLLIYIVDSIVVFLEKNGDKVIFTKDKEDK